MFALAEQIALAQLVDDQMKIKDADADTQPGQDPDAKSIEDIERLRHAGNSLVFNGVRASSTLGTFLKAFKNRRPTAPPSLAPSVHVRAIITWQAIFPLVAIGMTTLSPFTIGRHLVLRSLVLTLIVAASRALEALAHS